MAYFFKLPQITELTISQQSALNEPGAIAISGGPGTGKSVVSLWRHIRNYGIGKKKSLLLTYTKTLEAYLASSAKSENENAGNAVDRTYRWTTHGLVTYAEIIVDEAQDVESDRYSTIKRYSNTISYGADDQQIVYPKKSTTEAQLKALFPTNSKHELDENFRNSYDIMLFVKALFPNKKISQNILSKLLQQNRRGNKPILLISNNDYQKQLKAIIDIINQFKSDTHNIAILVPLRWQVKEFYTFLKGAGVHCSKFESDDADLVSIENVHITTFKSSKGTEFDTVIIPDFENMENNISKLDVVDENDYYVALTRAKRNLYLLSKSSIGFLQRTPQQSSTYNIEILS